MNENSFCVEYGYDFAVFAEAYPMLASGQVADGEEAVRVAGIKE